MFEEEQVQLAVRVFSMESATPDNYDIQLAVLNDAAEIAANNMAMCKVGVHMQMSTFVLSPGMFTLARCNSPNSYVSQRCRKQKASRFQRMLPTAAL